MLWQWQVALFGVSCNVLVLHSRGLHQGHQQGRAYPSQMFMAFQSHRGLLLGLVLGVSCLLGATHALTTPDTCEWRALRQRPRGRTQHVPTDAHPTHGTLSCCTALCHVPMLPCLQVEMLPLTPAPMCAPCRRAHHCFPGCHGAQVPQLGTGAVHLALSHAAGQQRWRM